MTTREPAALRWLADQWEAAVDSARGRDDAATFAGIVGDLQHRREGGYHISREDQPAENYSVCQFSDDRAGPSDQASAVDMTMDTADMIAVTGRLAAAWRAQDRRLANVRGFNGTTDGVNACRWDAINADPHATDAATDDHLWHVHLEIYRRWADDMATMRDILAVIVGDQNHPTPAGSNDEGDPMQAFVMVEGDSTIYLTDGIAARPIGSEGELADLVTLANEGTLRINLTPGGNCIAFAGAQVRVVGRRELLGVVFTQAH